MTPPTLKKQLTEKGAIFTFWHGKMVAGWLLAKSLLPDKQLQAVVSLSEDGRILSDALEQFDYTLIRGSSSKGADEVKLAMQKAISKEQIIVLTPDGPRGPVNQFKYGTLRIASTNNYQLIFAEINYTKAWKLKSWDKFEIPRPFSKTTVKLHTIDLPDFISEEELRIYTKKLSDFLGHA